MKVRNRRKRLRNCPFGAPPPSFPPSLRAPSPADRPTWESPASLAPVPLSRSRASSDSPSVSDPDGRTRTDRRTPSAQVTPNLKRRSPSGHSMRQWEQQQDFCRKCSWQPLVNLRWMLLSSLPCLLPPSPPDCFFPDLLWSPLRGDEVSSVRGECELRKDEEGGREWRKSI